MPHIAVPQLMRKVFRFVPAIFLFVCLLLVFGTPGYMVYGSCMEPELHTGEHILASRYAYLFHQPDRGDVVVFRYPLDPQRNYVKRVVGIPGDMIEIRGGVLYINSEVRREPYKLLAAHGDFGPVKVMSGFLFVLGDNRDASNDSRYWGELPIRNIEAKAILSYWPIEQIHSIE